MIAATRELVVQVNANHSVCTLAAASFEVALSILPLDPQHILARNTFATKEIANPSKNISTFIPITHSEVMTSMIS